MHSGDYFLSIERIMCIFQKKASLPVYYLSCRTLEPSWSSDVHPRSAEWLCIFCHLGPSRPALPAPPTGRGTPARCCFHSFRGTDLVQFGRRRRCTWVSLYFFLKVFIFGSSEISYSYEMEKTVNKRSKTRYELSKRSGLSSSHSIFLKFSQIIFDISVVTLQSIGAPKAIICGWAAPN